MAAFTEAAIVVSRPKRGPSAEARVSAAGRSSTDADCADRGTGSENSLAMELRSIMSAKDIEQRR